MAKTSKLNLPQRPRRLRRYPSLCCAGMLACLAAVAGFAAKPAAVPPRNSIGRDLADRQGDGGKGGIIGGVFAAPVDRQNLLPRDSITALVSLTKGDDFYQWLVVMTCAELTTEEKKRP